MTQIKTIDEINQIYDLELDKVIKNIQKHRIKKVLLQFPEGLKSYSQEVVSFIENKTGCECFIWMGSCFGACDLPLEVEKLGIDLIVHFGHNNFNFNFN